MYEVIYGVEIAAKEHNPYDSIQFNYMKEFRNIITITIFKHNHTFDRVYTDSNPIFLKTRKFHESSRHK